MQRNQLSTVDSMRTAQGPHFSPFFYNSVIGTEAWLLFEITEWMTNRKLVQSLAYLSNDLMCCFGTSAIPCRRLQVGSLMSLDAWMLHDASHTFPLRQNLLLLLRRYTVFHLRRVNHHCWPPQRKRLLVRTVRTVTLELAQQKHTKAGKVSCL